MTSPDAPHDGPDRPGVLGSGLVGPLLMILMIAVVSGVLAGLVGVALNLLLALVERVAFGDRAGELLTGVGEVPRWQRIVVPTIGGLLAGVGWWRLRRSGPLAQVRDSLDPTTATDPVDRRLPIRRTVADAVLQIVAVGAGASVGREGAPRQVAAALTELVCAAARVVAFERRVLLAAAAGAGLAAVYDVPLAGAVYALEVLLLAGPSWPRLEPARGPRGTTRSGARAWTFAVVIATVTSVVATLVTHALVGSRPIYAVPGSAHWSFDPSWLVLALLVAPVCAVGGWSFRRAVGLGRDLEPGPTWRLPLAVAGAGALVGIASCWFEAIPGNGKTLVEVALAGHASFAALLGLLLLKPLVTSIAIGAGTRGGLLTPSLATGAGLGAVLAALAAFAGHGLATPPVLVLVCAVGVLAATERAPLFAACFGWELVRPSPAVLVPLVVVAVGVWLFTAAADHGRARLHRSTSRGVSTRP